MLKPFKEIQTANVPATHLLLIFSLDSLVLNAKMDDQGLTADLPVVNNLGRFLGAGNVPADIEMQAGCRKSA